jgi:protein-S-isoprenylcysteine O-methyltransferase Ste14
MPELARTLARHRVRLGFACAAVALWFAQPTIRSLAAGIWIAAAGEALRLWAAGHLEKGREVTASGPYRFTRHPLYLGSTLIGIGFAVASARMLPAVLVLGYMAITLTSAIRSEETHLTEKFGPAYPAYREGRAPQASRGFSLSRAIRNREYQAVLGLLAVLALLWWKTVPPA